MLFGKICVQPVPLWDGVRWDGVRGEQRKQWWVTLQGTCKVLVSKLSSKGKKNIDNGHGVESIGQRQGKGHRSEVMRFEDEWSRIAEAAAESVCVALPWLWLWTQGAAVRARARSARRTEGRVPAPRRAEERLPVGMASEQDWNASALCAPVAFFSETVKDLCLTGYFGSWSIGQLVRT